MTRGEGRLWDAFIPTVRHVKSGSVDLTKLTENCIKIELNSRRDISVHQNVSSAATIWPA